MAKTVSDEDIKLNIIVNGNSAQKELLDLEKATRDLTKETKDLSAQKKKMIAEGKTESAEYKALTKTIKLWFD